jgi:hypothetical protein
MGYRRSFIVYPSALAPVFSCFSNIDLFYGLGFAVTLSHPRPQKTPASAPLRSVPDHPSQSLLFTLLPNLTATIILARVQAEPSRAPELSDLKL